MGNLAQAKYFRFEGVLKSNNIERHEGNGGPNAADAILMAAPKGSTYTDLTAGKEYVRVATAGVAADWSTQLNKDDYDALLAAINSGGDATEGIQTELDAVEGAVGLGADGTLGAALQGTNYIAGQTTVVNAVKALDTRAKTNADAIAAEQSRAVDAETDLQTAIDGNTSSITGLQTELDATQAGAGLGANGGYTAPVGTNYLGTATSLKNADALLDNQIKTVADNLAQEVLDRGAAVSDEETRAVAAEATKVSKAGDTMTGNLVMSNGGRVLGLLQAASADEPVTKAQLEGILAGLDFQPDVIGRETDFAGVAGRYIYIEGVNFTAGATGASNGDIVVVDAAGNVTAVSYDVSVAGNGALVWNKTAEYFEYWNEGYWTEHGGLSGVTAGVGLSKDGNTIHVNLGAGIVELPTDEVGLDLHATGGLMLTEDGTSASSSNVSQLAVKLDGATLTVGANGLKVADTTIARITTLETDLAQEVLDRQADVEAEETRAIGVEGLLANLTTTAKGTLVAAINEVKAAVGTEAARADGVETGLAQDIADETTARETAVADINAAILVADKKQTELAALVLAARKESAATGVGAVATTVDQIATRQVEAAKWTVFIKGTGADAQKRTVMEVLAMHNGTATVDADEIDSTAYAKLKLGVLPEDIAISLVLTGVGAEQRMQLKVASPTMDVDVYAVRERLPGIDLDTGNGGSDGSNWTPGTPDFLFGAQSYTPNPDIVF